MSIGTIGSTVNPKSLENPKSVEKPKSVVNPKSLENPKSVEKPNFLGNSTAATAGIVEPHVIRAMSIFDEASRVGQNAQPKKNESIFSAKKSD